MLISRAAPVDTGHNGMLDQWEMHHGFDKSDPADAQQVPEEYLNSLTPFNSPPPAAGTKLIMCYDGHRRLKKLG
jgi:hypothetical protein